MRNDLTKVTTDINKLRAAHCSECGEDHPHTPRVGSTYSCIKCGHVRSITINPVLESYKNRDWCRFWGNVKVTPFCWPWMSPTRSKQGPRFSYKGVSMRASRLAFYFYRGVWPEGSAIRKCGNQLCMRPDHMLSMKQKDVPVFMSKAGRARSAHKRRKRCKRGHKLEGDNLILWKGERRCRECQRMMARRRYRSKVGRPVPARKAARREVLCK